MSKCMKIGGDSWLERWSYSGKVGRCKSSKEIEDGISSNSTVTWDPFLVFPKQIYIEIFKNLDNPKDKQCFLNSHKKLRNLFKKERVCFLFGQVFHHLKLEEKDIIEDWENEWDISALTDESDMSDSEDEFYVPKYLEFKSILFDSEDDTSEDSEGADSEGEEDTTFNRKDKHLLPLRLVCREWNQSIRNHYQSQPDYFQFAFCGEQWNYSEHDEEAYANGYRVEWQPLGGSKARLDPNLEEYLASPPPSKNPFLVRKVKVDIRVHNSSMHFYHGPPLWSQFETLLDTYGQRIWHFRIRDGLPFTTKMYSKIMQWLRLMPQLKTLQIEFGNGWCAALVCDRKTKEVITRTAIPKVKTLQYLNVSNFPGIFIKELLYEMDTLKKLDVHKNKLDFSLVGYNIPKNLTELNLTFTRAEDFKYLEKLQPLPLLRKLSITIELHNSTLNFRLLGERKDNWYSLMPWPDWKTIWNTIEEKFPALENLHLSLPRQPMANLEAKRIATKQSWLCRMKLKKLTRLNILLPNLCCLDFLQEMRELQELEIDYLQHFQNAFEHLDKAKLNEKVQFNRDLSKMWGSNIWKLLPNLRKLSIRTFCMDERKRRVFQVHSYEKVEKDKKYNKTIQQIPQDSHYMYYL